MQSTQFMTEQTATAHKTHEKLYIKGQWVEPTGDEKIDVENPATEAIIGSVPNGNAEDVDKAVQAAVEAFPDWSSRLLEERLNYLDAFHKRYVERTEEIAQNICSEVGTPIAYARQFMTKMAGDLVKSAIQNAREYQFEYDLKGSRIVREPFGVVAAISPWNNPMFLALHKIALPWAAGCTVVHKPASNTPGAGYLIAEICDEIGLPAGVFNLVSGSARTVGEALVKHPDVDLVDFTGSLEVGPKIMEGAASTVKKVILELGGKSPSIILDDADLPKAVETTIASCFLLAGQTCGAFSRMLVPQSILNQVVELCAEIVKKYPLGDPTEENTVIGPVVSASQREKIWDYIRSGQQDGAKLLCGGDGQPKGFERGYYVKPTIFSNVNNRWRIAQEEIFGPVLCIISYEDDNDAVRLANDTIYGLRAIVWSNDVDRAVNVGRRIRAGWVDINGDKFRVEAPWGGYKQSGFGRCMGRIGFEEFLQIKTMQISDDLLASFS